MSDGSPDRSEMLRAFLAECDEPCPACGYNLRGLTGEACPECGEGLRLRVGMVEPRLGLFVAGLIGLAAGAGFHTILGILALPQALSNPRGGVEVVGWAVLYGGAVVCSGGLVAWVRTRRRMRRLGTGLQVFWLTLGWLVPAVTVGWFLSMVV
ncbi:MAG: hypothetical protein IT431_03655 [Phycisphaerales bacterium]|nr:hypothetical protein [Phycisphaerales bacterium]